MTSAPVDATVPVDARSLTMGNPDRPDALTNITTARKHVSRALHPSTSGAYPVNEDRARLLEKLRVAAVALDGAARLLDTTPGPALPVEGDAQ